MAVATYPGTVSPLRGLDSFGESERDVWQGREKERDELSRLVTADTFRAGLLFGEPGVGKTSLVRAGLIPDLRDHGIVALACEDLGQPAASFAQGLSAFGIQPNAGEAHVAFIARAVSNAVQGQQFVFVVDDVDLACHDERIIGELAELYTKVVSRSAGKARFLFVCAAERLNLLSALERRTGSLFPPSNRFELPRMPQDLGTQIFDRVLSLSGVAADPQLAQAVVHGLDTGTGVLAADLQIAAMAMRDLKITSIGALQKLGGATELEAAWLHDACKATGNERSALRLCAELADGPHGPRSAETIIRRTNLEAGFAQSAFGVLEQRGVIVRADQQGTSWMLRHEVLTPRLRVLGAPARAAARRAYDLLGSKIANKSRLTLLELYSLRHEGISPSSAAEVGVVQRSKRYYMTIAGGVAAVPIIILLIILFSMRGRVFFDLQPSPGGDHVLVRGGRSGLSSFGWLPGSHYGIVYADTGLTRSMVAPEAWKKIDSHDLGSSRDDWDKQIKSIMAPQLAGLMEYATTGNEATLESLKKAAKDPEDLAELLTALRPIARGTPAEIALVEQALKMPNPAVQRAAVAVAGAAAQRGEGYKGTLVKALTSQDPELRRIAFSTVRSLGDRGKALFSAALSGETDAGIRRELMGEASGATTEGPSVASAIGVLADESSSPVLVDRAKAQIRGAMAADALATGTAITTDLITQDHAPLPNRKFAIDLMLEQDPMPKVPNLAESVRQVFNSKSEGVRAAILPLYAKLDPTNATTDLQTMMADGKLDESLRVAMALGWGQVALTNKEVATDPIDKLLGDPNTNVRAAASQAAGMFGRQYQEKLIKSAKAESYAVRKGAARGLALSAIVGASGPVAVGGIAQMWKEKGTPRRDATRIFADLAKKKPGLVLDYLTIASKINEDPSLHPIGVEGLCYAANVGSPEARKALARATDDESLDVRKLVMNCVADGPEPAKNGAAIAARLIKDPDGEIRGTAARVLAMTVEKGSKVPPAISDALVALLADPNRDVRMIGIRAIGQLGADAPKQTATDLAKLFERADQDEKLVVLRTARDIGASDLVAMAVADGSPAVRVAAVDAALTAGLRPGQTLSAALADADPQVRKAALDRIASQKDKIDAQVLDRALSLAARDPDPELSQLALTTIARTAPKEAVQTRLKRALSSRVERVRAQAAAAAVGLVDRDAAMTAALLEPLLQDPSRDVRVAMLPALAAAYSKTNTPEKLAELMRSSEGNAMRRLVAAAAFITLAKTDAGRSASELQLKKLENGPPMARMTAKLISGLIDGKTDGMAFVQELVP
ncbi:MAG TPA: HEAT repeat domain-containing protein [Kofleriaceae bacterium]|nr:HEAT repeat domain-containing protein [Kofleriaceae bacterium]